MALTSARLPKHIAELVLLGRCGEHLVKVMRGETEPQQLILPEIGKRHNRAFMDSSPSFQIYNRIAAVAVKEIVNQWPMDRRLRVLEIGGGTGGLAASLLPIFSQPYALRIYRRTRSCLDGPHRVSVDTALFNSRP